MRNRYCIRSVQNLRELFRNKEIDEHQHKHIFYAIHLHSKKKNREKQIETHMSE